MTNLNWPDTPYGADKRPVTKTVHLLTGMAMHWADDGQDTVPVSAAAVFLPVKRTQPITVHADTLHFGFRVAVAEHDHDASELLRFVDGILVQGRRHAAVLAWHSFADDLHVMQDLASERLPGVEAVGQAWQDRTHRERGCAPLADTADDLDGTAELAADTAQRHGIELGMRLRELQRAQAIQRLHDALTDNPPHPEHLLNFGAAVLAQALAVALLAGKAASRLTWDAPLDLAEAIERGAWHALEPVAHTGPQESR
jgi:hypothetical protein